MISRSGVHAIRALAVLAALPRDAFAGAAWVAREIDAPVNYLGKLLQTFTRGGLVISRKGAGGGFRLGKPPQRISLLDALEPIEQVSRWKQCVLGLPRCSDDRPCAIHKEWGPLRDRYLALLGRTTIADVLHGMPWPITRGAATKTGLPRPRPR